MKHLNNRFILLAGFLSAILLLTSTMLSAQYWMQKAGGLTVDEAYDISIDGSGNTYTVGYFTGNATFGSVTLVSSGSTDMFITKTDNTGNFVWAKKAGGSGSDRALSVATDNLGNSFVTGYFNGTATFGGTSITSSGLQDLFIAKYNNAGVLQWVKKAGGTQSDIGFGIAINSWGETFVTGSFKGSATFGSTTITSANTTSDVFITKLNSSGVFQWTKKGIGNYSNRGTDLGCDNNGNVYITGQYSDTITFTNTHPNTMQNVIFIAKFNTSGAEQWFKTIGAGLSNTVNSMVVNGTGECFLTGDFTGNLTFFSAPNNTTITNPYINKVFVAKYSNSGNLSWAIAEGSDNEITARTISLDGSGNSYIGGDFKCVLNQYADSYGQGTFNSVGNFDVFVSKYSSSGTWQNSRNMGGRSNDYCYGITLTSAGNIQMAGSFAGNLNIPTSSNFLSSNLANWTDVSCSNNTTYCSDPDYGSFHSFSSAGNRDVVIARSFDLSRQPYDYYNRSGGGCNRPEVGVCIDSLCPATITACGIATMTAQKNTCDNIGPAYSYNWSNGVIPTPNPRVRNVNVAGVYHVTQSSTDGCFSTEDSIQVIINPLPPKPAISDNHGFNTNAFITTDIELCQPDSAILTGSAFGNNTYWWTGPGLPPGGVFDTTITVATTSVDTFHVVDANGCENFNVVNTTIYPSTPPIGLKLLLEDSVVICEGDPFTAQIYDSLTNPSANPICLNYPPLGIITSWTISPIIVPSTTCATFAFIDPTVSGWYQVQARFVIGTSVCGFDTMYVSDSVYVTVNPKPVIPPFSITLSGSPFYCPGGSVDIHATGAPNYSWSGPGVNGSTDSTVTVNTTGNYQVGSIVFDTNSFGCVNQESASNSVYIQVKQQPSILASDLTICPGDSVQLSTGQFGTHYWEGPNGPLPDSVSSVYVTDPGQYFVMVNDSDSCALISNTITLLQYTTPQLATMGDTFICDGDSTVISVLTNPNSTIEWQAPLSGSNPSQVIYTAGTYTCKITSCGIVTFTSITISSSAVLAQITSSGVLCKDSTITLSGLPGMASYLWTPGNFTTPNIPVSSSGTYSLSVTDTNGCSGISLPYAVTEIDPQATIQSTALGFCFGDSLILTGNSDMASYIWNPTGDTTQSIITTSPGSFTLSVVDTNGCPDTSDPVQISMADTFASVSFNGLDYFCEGDSAILAPNNTGQSTYIWQPGNIQTPNLVVYQTGNYSLTTIDSLGCVANSDTFNIVVATNTLVEPIVSDDTVICAGVEITLFAVTDTGNAVWYNPLGGSPIFVGDTLTTKIMATTTYYIRTESEPCVTDYSSITVETLDCDAIDIPNVFTPNGDGINDNFKVLIHEATCFNLEIYNRWGVLIYTFLNDKDQWDGTMYTTGEEAPDGVYFYIVNYCKYNGETAEAKGSITLIRD